METRVTRPMLARPILLDSLPAKGHPFKSDTILEQETVEILGHLDSLPTEVQTLLRVLDQMVGPGTARASLGA